MSALLAKLRGARQLPLLLLVAALAIAALVYLSASGGGALPGDAAGTALEVRMASVLSQMEGAGRVRVLLREREIMSALAASAGSEPLVEGAVVVAQGANDIRVALALQRAVKALLGVPIERIEVLAMEEGGG